MESRDHEDNVSEAFYSDTSGDPRAATPPNLGTAAEPPTTRPGLAGVGAPGSNPGRPDLTIPDLSTPEGLATARMVLQRVVDGTNRTGQGAGLSWANLGQGQGTSTAHVQETPVNQTTMGAYYSRATSVASSSVPQAAGGANPVTPSPMVSNPMLGGTYLGLTSTAGPTPMGYSTLVPPSTARSAIPTYGIERSADRQLTRTDEHYADGIRTEHVAGRAYHWYLAGGGTGYRERRGLTAQTPIATTSLSGPSQSLPQGGATPTTAGTPTTTAYGGMPSRIKNAVKMIQPFYSEGSTVEKARAFWNAFERATVGLEEQLRLSAFRECLKGKTAEDWWIYSLIPDFETLRTRFHNQFVCLTPLQMIERLKNAKRTKGMSAEVWGDLISGLCNEAQCYDPQMRYQYFLSGLRNREWKAALNTLMVNSIEGAVIVLLAKNMHQPVEDDADFVDAAPFRVCSRTANDADASADAELDTAAATGSGP
ncbi:hypothetical protein PF005_g17685 [Phytophthora fragariae]|uniref:Retrotransposon gag domain-containing protein n=2 Tax=Phytophthora fragariae TaxID=53985 RepID=A0A6A3X8M1_9STRA|nr:hypothetical protein PF009_g18829 [Phytophthora fragariae]KAE9097176.1 hypothetical protein PF007_g16717 [Phytophthora fragariae]KAE9132041.1 hypothetical protein PF006_g15365 [Phytophthora fragariae]KAE9194430.1 hypothetical protein PF005_g17685 [Phytophthora fragariae]KAE9298352.1 hypothetical protein PF001_g15968 [Phytophthora fragariae]